MPRARLGRFELLERLGHGGSGEVFVARDPATGARVVLKRLLPHLKDDRELGERFLREAAIGARLSHPNISRVLELGELGGTFFFTQEFIEGGDVSKLGPVSTAAATRIIADAAAGLFAAHSATERDGRPMGVVHGDVAPKNLVVGTDGRTRLIDFGLATLHSTSTEEGSLGGTYEYMSPEQALDGVTSPSSDQFSLGVIFWELLTGRRLFAGDTDTLTLDQVLECRVSAPRDLNPRVPEALEAVVLRMLQKDPAERFGSCGEVAQHLEAFLRNQPQGTTTPPRRAEPTPVDLPAAAAALVKVTSFDRAVLSQLEALEAPFAIETLEASLRLPAGSPPALDVAQSLADRGLLSHGPRGLQLTPQLDAFDLATDRLARATEADRPDALAAQLRAILDATGLVPEPRAELPPLRADGELEAQRLRITLDDWCSWTRATLEQHTFTCELSWFVARLHALDAPWALVVARQVLAPQ
jgi:serine/threonine protein kinase